MRTENNAANLSASSFIEVKSSKSNSPKTNSGLRKASECDWEELFDDSGDFVDETLIDEVGVLMSGPLDEVIFGRKAQFTRREWSRSERTSFS